MRFFWLPEAQCCAHMEGQKRRRQVTYPIRTDAKWTTRIADSERIAGHRAAFHIYYKNHKGQVRFDASFVPDIDDAVEEMLTAFLIAYGKRGKEFQIIGIAPLDPTISVATQ